MSEHKKQGVVAAKHEGAIISEAAHANYDGRFKTKLGVGLAGIIVSVALVTYIADKLITHSFRHETRTQSQNPTVQESPANTAIKLSNEGKIADAEQVLLKQLSTAKQPQAQSTIYSQLTSIAFSADQNQQALMYAQKAEAIYPSASNEKTISDIQLAMGDTAAAKVSLEKAISSLDKNALSYAAKERQYQAALQELGGS